MAMALFLKNTTLKLLLKILLKIYPPLGASLARPQYKGYGIQALQLVGRPTSHPMVCKVYRLASWVHGYDPIF